MWRQTDIKQIKSSFKVFKDEKTNRQISDLIDSDIFAYDFTKRTFEMFCFFGSEYYQAFVGKTVQLYKVLQRLYLK